MRNRAIHAVLLVIVGGCASESRLPDSLASEATPMQWMAPSTQLFRVFDSRGKSLGTFTLELTNEAAKTCIAGEWRRARPIASDLTVINLSQWWADSALWPSYQITGRLLNVQLNGGAICDAYTEVNAELQDNGARGFLEIGGIIRGPGYGSVVVEKVPQVIPAGPQSPER